MNVVQEEYLLHLASNTLGVIGLYPNLPDGSPRFNHEFPFVISSWVERIERSHSHRQRINSVFSDMNDETLASIIGSSMKKSDNLSFLQTEPFYIVKYYNDYGVKDEWRRGGHAILAFSAKTVVMAAMYDIAATCAMIHIQRGKFFAYRGDYTPKNAMKKWVVRNKLIPAEVSRYAVA